MYSTKQVAKLLGYNDDSYIRKLILEGKLKASKFNRQWLIKNEDIENYKKNLTVGQVKHRELFQFNEELDELTNQALNGELKLRGPKDAVVSLFTTKAFKTHRALLSLCRGGFGEDSAILSRSLFESMVNLLYILNDPTDEMAYRYFTFDWIIQKRTFESMKDKEGFMKAMKEREENPKKGDTTQMEIAKEAEVAEKRFHYGKSESWSNKNMREMAKAIDREEAYLTAYRLSCQMAHSSSRAMMNYSSQNETGLTLKVDDPLNWVQESLVSGFDFFLYIVHAFNKQFGLGIEKKLDDLTSKYLVKLNQDS